MNDADRIILALKKLKSAAHRKTVKQHHFHEARILETINYNNPMGSRIFEIISAPEKNRREQRIDICEELLKQIKNKAPCEIEPYLSEVSISTETGGVILALTFPVDYEMEE